MTYATDTVPLTEADGRGETSNMEKTNLVHDIRGLLGMEYGDWRTRTRYELIKLTDFTRFIKAQRLKLLVHR